MNIECTLMTKINVLKVSKIESKLILKLDLTFQFNSSNLCITTSTGHVLHNSIMNECKLLLHFKSIIMSYQLRIILNDIVLYNFKRAVFW